MTQAEVVDASVLAAFAFGESGAAEAAELVGDHELYEPMLMPFEMAHVATKKARDEPSRAEEIIQGFQMVLSLDLNWVDVDYIEVVALALERRLSAYDASYLYVARLLGLPLVTFDERLRRAQRADQP